MPVNSFADHPLSWQPPKDALSARPAYLALAAALGADIAEGRLPPGARLPPQRELADFLDIDFTTVTRAYNVCREQGLIYGVTGRGTFVASPGDDSAAYIDCGVVQGFPETGAAEIVSAAREVLARASAERLFSYNDRDGASRHRAAGARWLERSGINTPSDCVAVFPGAQSAISTALITLFRVGDKIAVDEFTYANFISLAHLAHLKLVPVPSDSKGMIPDKLDEATREGRIKGAFLMPHCANPTGRTISPRRRKELAEIMLRHGITLIEDDANIESLGKSDRPFFSMMEESSVHISGTTRHIAPGLRVTYMAFPEKFSARLLSGLHHLAIKASALDTEIMSELIVSGRAERILEAKAQKARKANAVFDSVFPRAAKKESAAFFRTLPLPGTAGRGHEIERMCLAQGVRVLHSDRFSVRSGNPDSFLRISVSSAGTLTRLRRALTTLDSLLSHKIED